jgi:hypothetical protein
LWSELNRLAEVIRDGMSLIIVELELDSALTAAAIAFVGCALLDIADLPCAPAALASET